MSSVGYFPLEVIILDFHRIGRGSTSLCARVGVHLLSMSSARVPIHLSTLRIHSVGWSKLEDKARMLEPRSRSGPRYEMRTISEYLPNFIPSHEHPESSSFYRIQRTFRLPPVMVTLTKRRVYLRRFIARPLGCFFFSCASTCNHRILISI